MRTIIAATVTALGIHLAQPAALAHEMCRYQAYGKEVDVKLIKRSSDELSQGLEVIDDFISQVQEAYKSLISLADTSQADMLLALSQIDVSMFKAAEMFCRAHELVLKRHIEDEQLPGFFVNNLTGYYKRVVKARSFVTKFNQLVKQVTIIPKTYE
ncbi:hypothetical protein LGZ99_19500 [Photorhabdus temperata]|uniref:Uncharacterized protein n=1 Tax=Photorhabdus temperata subsp. temperata Meg1 TaxID=1393735 RepID=A0A081RVL9_PHOTE|nr:hypothetical protein [Photorhabdus temperata]KER02722.1 hypothetical protein MEG1DRAFT_02653 [Photorhabdus temperata subsp. temperata Meg1]MCT8349315.1 hypothetical protein [Photorhabdus temperata]